MKANTEIEVVATFASRQGSPQTDRGTAPDPESAIVAARTLFDDLAAANHLRRAPAEKCITIVFLVDGQHVRTVRRRP